MSYAMYLRKSRAEEASQTLEDTLRLHRKLLTDYAQKNGLVIQAAYEEVVSGESLFARPQMLRLLQDVQAGLYQGVLCMDLDRLGRGGMQDQGVILDTFKNSGTKIITPEHIYDLSDETDEELTELKTFISRREYKIINKRLRRGLNDTITSGGYIPNAPYGYKKAVQNRRPTLEIVEEEAKFVRMMFQLYAQGVGCSAIAQTVNSLGAVPRRTAQFQRTTIRLILRNPVYTGKVVWNRQRYEKTGELQSGRKVSGRPREDWLVVDGLHEPIIEQSLFDEVGHLMQTHSIPSHRDGTVKNPFSGVIRCQKCSRVLVRQAPAQKEAYLLCPTAGCTAGAHLELVQRALLECLGRVLRGITLRGHERPSTKVLLNQSLLEGIRRELSRCTQQQNRLYELLEQGVYPVDTYRQRMQVLTHKQSALQTQEAQLAHQAAQLQGLREQGSKPHLSGILQAYAAAGAAGRNQLLKGLCYGVSYSKARGSAPEDFTLEVYHRSFYPQL